MRRILWILIPALLLAGAYLLNTVAADWRFVVDGAPGELLYATTFAAATDDEWETFEGRLSAQMRDSVIEIEIGEENDGAFSDLRWNFGDFDLRANTYATAGTDNNAYGVVFRVQDPANYYTFLISSDGFYRVERTINGVVRGLSDWFRSDAITQGIGSPNRVRVVGIGDTFRFFINDQPVQVCIPTPTEANPDPISTVNGGQCIDGEMQDLLIDTTFDAGRIGVVAQSLTYNAPEDRIVVAFDDIFVYSPETDFE